MQPQPYEGNEQKFLQKLFKFFCSRTLITKWQNYFRDMFISPENAPSALASDNNLTNNKKITSSCFFVRQDDGTFDIAMYSLENHARICADETA